MVQAAISWHSVGRIITLDGRITAREYVDKLGTPVHPMNQTFLNDDTVIQDDTAETDSSQFDEHEGELQQLLWPA
jgi:hypothetical protein